MCITVSQSKRNMYEPDWVEEMVAGLEKAEAAAEAQAQERAQDQAEAQDQERVVTRWTPAEIAQFHENTVNWCRARNNYDKQKAIEREHRNQDPELRAAKEAMLRESLRAIQRHHNQQQ